MLNKHRQRPTAFCESTIELTLFGRQNKQKTNDLHSRGGKSLGLSAAVSRLRTLAAIQQQLEDFVGPKPMTMIEGSSGPIKIVSDALIEWLPIGTLPLSMRDDCSRINATPGNLMIVQLTRSDSVTVTPEAIRKVLVVSSFQENDRLRDMLVGGLSVTEEGWRGKSR